MGEGHSSIELLMPGQHEQQGECYALVACPPSAERWDPCHAIVKQIDPLHTSNLPHLDPGALIQAVADVE